MEKDVMDQLHKKELIQSVECEIFFRDYRL